MIEQVRAEDAAPSCAAGEPPRLTVTMHLDALRTALDVGRAMRTALDAGRAMRTALDAGRAMRTAPRAIRRALVALVARDGGCSFRPLRP